MIESGTRVSAILRNITLPPPSTSTLISDSNRRGSGGGVHESFLDVYVEAYIFLNPVFLFYF